MTDPYIGINGTKIDFFDNELSAVKTLAQLSGGSLLITDTRDMTTASGDVAYTGFGFKPTIVLGLAVISGTLSFSIGFTDGTTEQCITQYAANTFEMDAYLLWINVSAGNSQRIIIKSFDAGGLTLTCTKTGTPTGTAKLSFLCFR